jgi:lipoprotein-anchoring transpeptidase ErfK/SrfK
MRRAFSGLFELPSLLAVLGVMLASPAGAQTVPESQSPSTGTPGAETQSHSPGAPTIPNPVTPSPGSVPAPPATGSVPHEESTPGINETGSSILITIDKAKQKMTVSVDGVQQYEWPVSTGRAGYSTPSGTYTPTSMNEVWYSQEWDNAPMPHAIFFMKDGHAIHGSYEVKTLGKPVSHGCVRISPKNAATLYALVKNAGVKNTQVVLTGVTPGGESNVASDGYPGWFESEDNYYASRRGYYAPSRRYRYYYAPQRPGFFEQLFGD